MKGSNCKESLCNVTRYIRVDHIVQLNADVSRSISVLDQVDQFRMRSYSRSIYILYTQPCNTLPQRSALAVSAQADAEGSNSESICIIVQLKGL